MGVRLATVNDSNEILKIYGQYIDTAITFEYTLPNEKEFEERVKSIILQYPYLVYEEDGNIIMPMLVDIKKEQHINGVLNYQFILTLTLHQRVSVKFFV